MKGKLIFHKLNLKTFLSFIFLLGIIIVIYVVIVVQARKKLNKIIKIQQEQDQKTAKKVDDITKETFDNISSEKEDSIMDKKVEEDIENSFKYISYNQAVEIVKNRPEIKKWLKTNTKNKFVDGGSYNEEFWVIEVKILVICKDCISHLSYFGRYYVNKKTGEVLTQDAFSDIKE